MAQWWLNSHPQTQPLFLQIGFPGSHPPYESVPRYAEAYLERDLPIDEVSEGDLAGQSPPFKTMRQHNTEVDHDSVVHQVNQSEEDRKRQRAWYLANVTMIDEKVGEIFGRLEARRYLENSVVVFTSDHGDCLTDHGHSQKWTMYDTMTRVPMLVWAPGRFDAGGEVDGLCQQMDIGPALLEMAGVEVDPALEAESLLPALSGDEWSGRDEVFAAHGCDVIL